MAGRIPQSFIDDLLSRVDIVDFIQKRVPLKKAGKNWQACCPFHDEKTPSFSVNPQKQFYYCFGCSKGGNVLGFAMDYGNLGFPEAVELLAREQGLEIPYEGDNKDDQQRGQRNAILEKLAAADAFYRTQLKSSPVAIDYLKNRGLSGAIARDYGLGVAPVGWDHLISKLGQTDTDVKLLEQAGLIIRHEEKKSWYDRFRDRIMFPIRDTRGRTIAFGGRVLTDEKPKYLNSPETPVFHKSRELYGLFEMLQGRGRAEYAIVVEGYMDVIALAQFGFRNAVATLGTSIGQPHLEKLFRHVSEVVFCFDGDEAGQRAAERALHASLPLMMDGRQVRFLFLPQGQDPDSMVRSEGNEAFTQRLKTALPLSEFLLQLSGLGEPVATPDAKAKAHAAAKPMILELPKGAFRSLMEQELGNRTGVRSQLEDAPAATTAAPTPEPAAPQIKPKPAMTSRTRINAPSHLIELLLQHPVLAKQIPASAIDIESEAAEEQLLATLAKYLRDKPDAEISSLTGYWMARYPEQCGLFIRLAGARLIDSVDAESAARDFVQTLSRWQAQRQQAHVQEQIRALDAIPWNEQTDAHKSEKRELLNQLREIKDLLSR